jgi:hypothetical protein
MKRKNIKRRRAAVGIFTPFILLLGVLVLFFAPWDKTPEDSWVR